MNKKILFIYNNYSTFVKTDYEIISAENTVTKYRFKPVKGALKSGIELLKQTIFLLFTIWKFDYIYIWFADFHAFIPVLFAKLAKKKSFVVIGGYDVARIPKLNYGVFSSKLRGWCAIYSMKNSTLNLTVSNYVDRKVKWLAKKSNTKMIYNCMNLEEVNNSESQKENSILTVGLINSENTYYIKGIDTFIEIAEILPEYKFKIIGITKEFIESLPIKQLPNLELVEPVEHHELETYYKKSKIYCQLSRSESFGVALLEGINFGCLPIITNIGGMPEIVDELGSIVKRNPKDIAEKIKDSIEKNSFPHKNEIANVRQLFSLKKRKDEVLKLFIQ